MSELKHYQILIFLSPQEGKEDEFHEWYEHTHLDDVLRTTETFTTAQRFGVVHQVGMEQPNSHLAIYDCMAESAEAAMADLNARRGDRDMTGPLDATNVAMWVVEPLSPQRTKPAEE